MKKSVFLIILLALTTQWSFAQRGEEATVYLSNGSVVKGWVTQQSNSDRYKVEIENGSIIYFTERSIKEIVYEEDRRRTKRSSGSGYRYATTQSRNTNNQRYKTTYKSSDTQWFPGRTPGYRGFADLGYTFGVGDYSWGRFEMSTSHGYQFNPSVFLGGGIGMSLYKKESESIMGVGLDASMKMFPVFADFRVNLLKEGLVIPFIGTKFGYSFGKVKATANVGGLKGSESESIDGLYFAPAIGVKGMVSSSIAINLSLGYTVQMIEEENFGGISLKAGIEF